MKRNPINKAFVETGEILKRKLASARMDNASPQVSIDACTFSLVAREDSRACTRFFAAGRSRRVLPE